MIFDTIQIKVRAVFSTSGARITGYSYAKKKKKKPAASIHTLYHSKKKNTKKLEKDHIINITPNLLEHDSATSGSQAKFAKYVI